MTGRHGASPHEPAPWEGGPESIADRSYGLRSAPRYRRRPPPEAEAGAPPAEGPSTGGSLTGVSPHGAWHDGQTAPIEVVPPTARRPVGVSIQVALISLGIGGCVAVALSLASLAR